MQIRKKLSLARRKVTAVEWVDYTMPARGDYCREVLKIDRRLFPLVAPLVSGGERQVGRELTGQLELALFKFGPPVQNPAQIELFLGPSRVPVFFLTVDDQSYAVSEQLVPF
jgi:hypothetical protein